MRLPQDWPNLVGTQRLIDGAAQARIELDLARPHREVLHHHDLWRGSMEAVSIWLEPWVQPATRARAAKLDRLTWILIDVFLRYALSQPAKPIRRRRRAAARSS